MGFRLKDTGIQQVRRKAREDFDKGAVRRAFQAAMTRLYCQDNPRIAERTFGWSRDAVQKGLTESDTGDTIADQERTGRPSYFQRLPHLQEDIRSLVETRTVETRMTANAVPEALVREKGYKEAELPAESTMRALLNKMGYRRGKKIEPQ